MTYSYLLSRYSFITAILLFVFSFHVVAQPSPGTRNAKEETGKITGKVFDSMTGETVIGANVIIAGTSMGDATDINGRYSIDGVQPGIYSLTVSYVSFTRKTITGVEVTGGNVTTVNVQLQPQTMGLEEVVVSASAATNSEAGLLSIQRKSIAMQDGLSSEFLSKVGDGNVAAAMKRVTGVTLMDDNDVYVRGLGNRYSNVQLNGSTVPSTSPNKKEAPIDLVGSGLVDNVVVQKTYTPDQSGEFSGGSVQITTREFPDRKNFSLSYSTSYNSVSTFDNTLGYAGSTTDFLGFDNGKRKLPAVLSTQRLTEGSVEKQAASDLHNSWDLTGGAKAIPSQSVSINYANQFNEDKLPIGVVSNFSYKYDRRFEPDKQMRRIQTASNVGSPLLRSDYLGDVGVEKAKLSGMLNLFLKPNQTTKVGLKNLYSNSVNNSTHRITGSFVNAPGNVRQTIFDFDRRSIFSSNLEFDKAFLNFYNSRLKANLSYSMAVQDRPDRRTTQYNEASDTPVYNIVFGEGGNTHYFAKQNDHNYSAELKYEFHPARILKVKMGATGLYKDRDFTARKFEYQDFDNNFPSDSTFFDPGITLSDGFVQRDIIDLRETSTVQDSYNGNQLLYAGYLSTIWNPISKMTWEIGARIENSDQEVEIINSNGQKQLLANVENLDLLPATNLTYSLTGKTNIRGAFSYTLARPEFREISRFRFQDFIGGQIVYGNPNLNRTKIQNYDLRVETYPNAGELFALSAFYKHFNDPIELFYRFTERSEVEYRNGDEAVLYGIELEGRKNLSEQLQVVVNGSFIFSETRVTDPQNVNRVANTERPMYGQSPYTINASAFYQFEGADLDLSLNYNTFGKRVVTVGKITHPDDEYEQSFHNLGLNATYRFQSAQLKLGIENLLLDDRVYKQGEVTTFRYEPGMTVEFGVSLTF